MGKDRRFAIAACAAALASAMSVGWASAQQHDDAVTLPREVVAAAAAFQGYMDGAATISPGFKTPDSVYRGLKTGAAYEQAQFQEGMVGYGAIVALQDGRFIDGVERAARQGPGREALVDTLLANPNQVMAIDGAEGAAGRVRAALGRRGEAVFAAGRAVKQSAYDVQHSAWSKARVPNPQKRLAELKSISAVRAVFTEGEEGRLIRSLIDHSRAADAVEAPSPLTVRALALAAAAALGEARTPDMPRLRALFSERTTTDCLRMSKLNLYQCMAVAGPHYEDIFCLGQHALMDTGQCVAKAASAGPALSPPPADRSLSPFRQASAAPLGPATTPRAFRAD